MEIYEQTNLEGYKKQGDKSWVKLEVSEEGEYLLYLKKQLVIVAKKNVDFIYDLIKRHCQMQEPYGYRFIVRHILEEKDIDIDIDAFNGGRNRKIYFREYYFPLKVLEALDVVYINKRGGMTWINEMEENGNA